MKKLIAILFSIIGVLIVFFIIKEHVGRGKNEDIVRFSNLSPEILGNEQITDKEGDIPVDDAKATLLVSLLSGETLISSHSIDFNKDTYGDQIIAVKTPKSPYIQIIVGLYNPLLGTYERSYEFITEIKQARTFSFTVMDITGTHENALVINGYSGNNESMLQVLLPKKNADSFELELIADLKAEGTIFIQQSSRTTSYAFSTSDGDSFPILAYTSDPAAVEGSLDQLHIMYDWDKNERKYVQKRRTRIAGKTINARELAKIQDGTEKTFATFLDNLWAKPTGFIENIPYLFFDYAEKEIIFLQGDTAEVYSWERSILRRNGILIYTTNTTIPNLIRRIDIVLISVDEISIKVTDDLKMLISSVATWDGNYKKHDRNVDYTTPATQKSTDEDITKLLQTTSRTIWKTDNGYDVNFAKSLYTANNATTHESGVFTTLDVQGEKILQFKSQSVDSIFHGFYRSQIIDAEISDTADTNLIGTRIILSPIKMRAGKIEPALDKVLALELHTIQN